MPAISNLTKLINREAIIKQPLLLSVCESADVSVDVLRLDLVHPVISGNKYFKLKVAIENALATNMSGIISFGGAYSNHLVALAYLCNAVGLRSIGVIRGEQPAMFSPTLNDAIGYGMKPIFVSRELYADKKQLNILLNQEYPGFKLIPEGGQSDEGVEGATEILQVRDSSAYDIIACAVGTGTMMAGLIKGASEKQELLGISSLKIGPGNDIENFIRLHSDRPFTIFYNYHFGGYAKKSFELIDFMNQLWQDHQLPTDFVYTAKLMFGIHDLIEKKHFSPGTRILAIHSGGLQGNRSKADKLIF
ncbi:1-aminocyclopropane-1-carboxylate deaminase/D-cysteine desulfhydrase [Flavitalea sp.]|nr:pyridoxal-phosphate dependent enzyme [Flavitalea sp.]